MQDSIADPPSKLTLKSTISDGNRSSEPSADIVPSLASLRRPYDHLFQILFFLSCRHGSDPIIDGAWLSEGPEGQDLRASEP